MPYGWTGTEIEVDLSRGKIEKQPGDPKLVENYLGGKGINAKILWDRVPPEIDAFSPDNLLIIGACLLPGYADAHDLNLVCLQFFSKGSRYFVGVFPPEMAGITYLYLVIVYP